VAHASENSVSILLDFLFLLGGRARARGQTRDVFGLEHLEHAARVAAGRELARSRIDARGTDARRHLEWFFGDAFERLAHVSDPHRQRGLRTELADAVGVAERG